MDASKERQIIRLWNELRLLEREGRPTEAVRRQIERALAERSLVPPDRRLNRAPAAPGPTAHVSSLPRLRDAAEGFGSSAAIRSSYSLARSSSLCSVKGSACLARRRQRSACSLKVARSITHQPSAVLQFDNTDGPQWFPHSGHDGAAAGLLRQRLPDRQCDDDDQRSAGDHESDRSCRSCRGLARSDRCLAIVVSDFPHHRDAYRA